MVDDYFVKILREINHLGMTGGGSVFGRILQAIKNVRNTGVVKMFVL